LLERLQRSWDLAGECMDLLMEDKSLFVFPLMSAVAMLVIIGSFAVPLVPAVGALSSRSTEHTLSAMTYVAVFVFYWLQFSIIIFFNTALVEVAIRRFDGENASLSEGLARAMSLLPVILTYAFIAATVGTVLRIVAERVGFIGRIVVGLVGFAWTVATALVVPVLAAEDVGPLEAIGRSVELIKKAWGEDIIGSTGIGVVFGLVMFALCIVGGFLVFAAFASHNVALGIVLLVVLVLTVLLLALVQATLQGIYSAALYRYANGDPASGGIDKTLLAGAFQIKT